MATPSRRILLVPAGNVLGHLGRTLALAEALDARGDEVHLVLSRAYASLRRALPPGIRVHFSPGAHARRLGPSDPIAHYGEGAAEDRANLERSSRMAPSERRRHGRRLARMLERDAEIVREVRPDAIVADGRVTPMLMREVAQERVIHLANMLGYPSFLRRLTGSLPYPLGSGRILVPGVRAIEYWRQPPPPATEKSRESLCGMFRWAGWDRLGGGAVTPPAADLFLSFGSTGDGARIVPWLLRRLPERYRVSAIAAAGGVDRPGTYVSSGGSLGSFLARAGVALCHGGHGTVMECILHRTPMIVFPRNIEQLEIGRQIERMGLGRLVGRPYRDVSGPALEEMVESLRGDERVRARLEKYSSILSRKDGAAAAASAVHRHLAAL